MLLTEKLRKVHFSPTEQILVDYILKEKENIRGMTMKEIARRTYTSPSLLFRIAAKVGCSGWEECKSIYLAEVAYLQSHFSEVDANFPFQPEDDLMTIAGKISELEREAIDDTRMLLDGRILRQATDMIAGTENILLVGTNPALVNEFKRNMERIRKRVDVIEKETEIIYRAHYATEEDCAIIISYSGENRLYCEAARVLRQHHVPIIAMTNMGHNTIASLADCSLKICTREKLYSKIAPYSSDISVIYLLDTLYSCYFAVNYRKNLTERNQITRRYESGRKSDTEQLREEE